MGQVAGASRADLIILGEDAELVGVLLQIKEISPQPVQLFVGHGHNIPGSEQFCNVISEMASMSYDEYEKFGWKHADVQPTRPETGVKYFTTLEQHQKGKLLHNLKHGFPKNAAADPEWLQNYIKTVGPYMYHATDADAARSILQEGLYPHDHASPLSPMPSGDDVIDCPECGHSGYRDDFNEDDPGYCPDCGNPVSSAGSVSRSPWAGQYLQPRAGHTYIGQEKYAAPYAKQGGKLLKIDLRKLDPAKMNADEDHFNMEFGNHTPSKFPVVRDIHEFNPPPSEMYFDPDDEGGGESLGAWADDALGRSQDTTHHSMSQGSMAYNGVIPPEAISLHTPGTVTGQPLGEGWGDEDPGPPKIMDSPKNPAMQPLWATSATDADNYEAKMFHGSNKGLLREIKTPFVTTDTPTDHPVSHEVSVTFRRPAHHFAPVLTPDMIDMYQGAGHDGIVAHRPEGGTWAIALDPGTVIPGHDHDFPYR